MEEQDANNHNGEYEERQPILLSQEGQNSFRFLIAIANPVELMNFHHTSMEKLSRL